MRWSPSSRLLVGAVATLLLTAPANDVRAQQARKGAPPPAPIMVVVDMRQVIATSKAAKGVQAQIDQQGQVYSKEVSKQEDDLQKIRAELERQRTILSQDAFNEKTKEFQQRYDELDRNVQGKRQALQQSFTEAMSKIENVALQVVNEIATERGANIVIDKQTVVFQSDGFDISQEALTRVDQKLPQVAVNLPKPGAETSSAPAARPRSAAPPAAPPPKKN